MKVVIAPDSFKGSLTAIQAAQIMEDAVSSVIDGCCIIKKPMADGGEGTLDAMLTSTASSRVQLTCGGADGQKRKAEYGMLNKHTAVIECAKIAGLTQIEQADRNPDLTTSYGIGEAILHALDQGCAKIIIGLGGSASNDGGLGMLQALGMKAWNKAGKELGPFGLDLLEVETVSFSHVDKRLAAIEIYVASDVENPLCGEHGATTVYGPQKGATESQIKRYDCAMEKYAGLIESEIKQSYQEKAGAGAAGGLGFALLCLGAKLHSGAKLIADTICLSDHIKDADLVLTGEGKSDRQTLYGKAPGYVSELAIRYHVPVVLLSGSLSDDSNALFEKFTACFSIINKPLTLEECMSEADELLFTQTKQVAHFFQRMKQY